jgi:hypothetical protein
MEPLSGASFTDDVELRWIVRRRSLTPGICRTHLRVLISGTVRSHTSGSYSNTRPLLVCRVPASSLHLGVYLRGSIDEEQSTIFKVIPRDDG